MTRPDDKRVVITGMGIVAPNAHGLEEYQYALKTQKSGIRRFPLLRDLKFGCEVGGQPQLSEATIDQYFTKKDQSYLSQHMLYAAFAAIDCWKDAGFKISQQTCLSPDYDTGLILGSGAAAIEINFETNKKTEARQINLIGSKGVRCGMISSATSLITGLFALGGQAATNSSACITGIESMIQGYQSILSGQHQRVLVGSSEGGYPYSWAVFDTLRILSRKYNEHPEKASRPMSASSGGFVPAAGAGMLMLEELESAKARSAKIYAELIGSHVNSGGQCNGGSLTGINAEAAERCLSRAIQSANIKACDIDFISAHLPGTMADPLEIQIWNKALACSPGEMPLINSTKSLIGHGLAAAGSMELVAAILQLKEGFVHGSSNCEDLRPELEPYRRCIVQETRSVDLNIVAKSGFGFGDVNAAVILKKWEK